MFFRLVFFHPRTRGKFTDLMVSFIISYTSAVLSKGPAQKVSHFPPFRLVSAFSLSNGFCRWTSIEQTRHVTTAIVLRSTLPRSLPPIKIAAHDSNFTGSPIARVRVRFPRRIVNSRSLVPSCPSRHGDDGRCFSKISIPIIPGILKKFQQRE